MAATAARRRAFASSPRSRALLAASVLVLLLLAGGCASGTAGTTTPGPGVTLTTSPTPSPSPVGVHEPSAGEKQALAKAAAVVEHPSTEQQKQRLKGYTAEGMAVIGYLVQVRGPGLLIATLVDARTAVVGAAGASFGAQPWDTKGQQHGEGETWAIATAGYELAPLLAKLKGVGDTESAVCGYVVGWSKGGSPTLWFDLKGVLRSMPETE
jgi:hypothetical protein